MKTQNSVSAIIFNANKTQMLLVEQKIKKHYRRPYDEGIGTFWAPPGGKIDPGQDDQQALAAEVKQETGYALRHEGALLYTSTKYMPHRDYKLFVKVFLACVDDEDQEPQPNDPDHEIIQAKWVNYAMALKEISRMPDKSFSEPLVDYMVHECIRKTDWSYMVFRNFESIHLNPL